MINLVGHYNRTTRSVGMEDGLEQRGYTKEQIQALRDQMKQVGKSVYESCGISFETDLSDYEYEYFDYMIELSNNYEKGVMPFKGSYSDQPAQIIEGLHVMEQLKYESQREQQREMERKQKQSKGNKR